MTTWRRRLPDFHDDRGTTLAELLVGMAIMTVFMAIFTGCVVSMAKTTSTVEAVTRSSGAVNTVFLRLYKLVRYAAAITDPGTGASGDWYVELSTVDADSGNETCTQLQLDVTNHQLRQRAWKPATSTLVYDWRTIADNVTNGTNPSDPEDAPFTEPSLPQNAATSFQRLTVRLTAAGPGSQSTTSSRGTMTFTALNSSASDSDNGDTCHTPPDGRYRP